MRSTIFRLWEAVQNNNTFSLTNKLQGGGEEKKVEEETYI